MVGMLYFYKYRNRLSRGAGRAPGTGVRGPAGAETLSIGSATGVSVRIGAYRLTHHNIVDVIPDA